MSVLASPPSTARRSPPRPRVGHTRPLPPPSNGHAPSYPERDTRSRFWWGQRSRGGLPSRWGKRGQGVRTERKGSDTRIERDEETPLVQRRRAALLRECILVKCTVSTYVRDNEDRGCRDLYGSTDGVSTRHSCRYDCIALIDLKSRQNRIIPRSNFSFFFFLKQLATCGDAHTKLTRRDAREKRIPTSLL